jgi:predicted acylesterase/phospholipase RssA
MLGTNAGDGHKYELLPTILKRHFHSDDEHLIETIRSEAEFTDLQSGELLQGDRSDDVYFLLSGRLRAYKAFLGHPKGNITGDYNFVPLVSLIKGRQSHGAMAQAIEQAAGDDIDSEDTWKTFFVIASDFSAGTEAVLDRDNLGRNVIASYAIPGALPPVFIGGHMLFDGGTFNNFPVDVMARIGAGQFIGVDLSSDRSRKFEIDRVPGTIAHLRDMLRPRKKRRYRLPSVPETLTTSSFINSLSKQKTMRKFADLLFQPNIERVGLLEWKRATMILLPPATITPGNYWRRKPRASSGHSPASPNCRWHPTS